MKPDLVVTYEHASVFCHSGDFHTHDPEWDVVKKAGQAHARQTGHAVVFTRTTDVERAAPPHGAAGA